MGEVRGGGGICEGARTRGPEGNKRGLEGKRTRGPEGGREAIRVRGGASGWGLAVSGWGLAVSGWGKQS